LKEAGMDAVIRTAEARDEEAILRMQSQLAAAHAAWDGARFAVTGATEPAYRAWLAQGRSGSGVMVLVAEVGGAVSGYMIAELVPAEPKYWATACVYVQDLFLEPAARGTGAAEAMVARARAWAVEEGVGMRALVAAGNAGGKKFFERAGFGVRAVEMGWTGLPEATPDGS
jgi:GNAT superfamily N-acetyltransferase